MSIDVSHRLTECRTSINNFLGDVINGWSLDCQNKSDAELAKSLKRIKKLQSDFTQAIGVYVETVESDQLGTPNF